MTPRQTPRKHRPGGLFPTSGQGGLTLVELMISMLLMTIVIGAVYGIYQLYTRTAHTQDQVLQMQQSARVALSDLEREVRTAGMGTDSTNLQPAFGFAGPYEVVFNANLDGDPTSTDPSKKEGPIKAMNKAAGPNQVPANPDGSIFPYTPAMTYNEGAETVRWTLDAGDNGVLDSSDLAVTLDPKTANTNLYRLYRQVIGYNETDNDNGTDIAADWFRGPAPYPDGSRPAPLFQYWIREDRNNDSAMDAGEDINGNNLLDEYLWGDDGSNGGIASNGQLEAGEITHLMTGNSGSPLALSTSGAKTDSGNADLRVAASATASSLVSELGRITRVVITVTSETGFPDKNFSNPAHTGGTYPYRDMVIATTVQPRSPTLSLLTGKPSVVVTASPESVACPAKSSTVTATVRNETSLPVPSTKVNFSTSSGSFSDSTLITTSSGTTDGSGRVSVTLYNSGSGAKSASVTGSAVVGSTTYTGITKIDFVSGPVDSIAVSATPSSLPANGTSTSSIVAALSDQCGNPVVDGTIANFSLATVDPGVGGSVNPLSSSTLNGSAGTTLTATVAGTTGTVTASSGTVVGSTTVIFTDCTLTLTPEFSAIPGDGTSFTNITGVLKDINGVVVPGATVGFTADEGTINTASGTTDSNGEVITSITSSPFPHVAVITGTVTTGACINTVGTTQVQFTGCDVSMKATPSAIATSGTSDVEATFTDSVTKSPLPNLSVNFSTDALLGSVLPLSSTTDSGGKMTTVFTAGAQSGTARVYATSACGQGYVDLPIKSCNIVMSSSKEWIKPDGTDTAAVTATVTDKVSGNYMSGEDVTFTFNPATTLGTIVTAMPILTNASGVATADVQSAGVGKTGVATLEATSICGSATMQITFSEWTIEVTASPTSINSSGGTSTISAVLKKDGVQTQPPANEPVSFSFVGDNLGSGFSATPVTPVSGKADTTLTSGTGTGTVTVKASATIGGVALSQQVNVTITASGGLILLDAQQSCTGKSEKLSLRVKNMHSDKVTIKKMVLTWDKPTAFLEKIKSEGTFGSCGGGTDLWKFDKCNGPGSRQASPATLPDTQFCKVSSIASSATHVFNEIAFKDASGNNISIQGVTFTIVFNYTVGTSDPTIYTSTITFKVP